MLYFAPRNKASTTFYAWMVELVDTTDLKSVDPKGRAGSSPAPGTKREIAAMRSPVFSIPAILEFHAFAKLRNKAKKERPVTALF